MAQTQSTTNQGYGETGKLMAGEVATPYKSVVLIDTSCTADETQTYAGISKCVATGLGITNATTVESKQTTVANDTVHLNHTFTAGASATIKGFGVCNDDDDVLFALCCFNADVALESGDTLEVDMEVQFKAD